MNAIGDLASVLAHTDTARAQALFRRASDAPCPTIAQDPGDAEW